MCGGGSTCEAHPTTLPDDVSVDQCVSPGWGVPVLTTDREPPTRRSSPITAGYARDGTTETGLPASPARLLCHKTTANRALRAHGAAVETARRARAAARPWRRGRRLGSFLGGDVGDTRQPPRRRAHPSRAVVIILELGTFRHITAGRCDAPVDHGTHDHRAAQTARLAALALELRPKRQPGSSRHRECRRASHSSAR